MTPRERELAVVRARVLLTEAQEKIYEVLLLLEEADSRHMEAGLRMAMRSLEASIVDIGKARGW